MGRRLAGLIALSLLVAACGNGDEAVNTTMAPTTTERPLPTSGPPRPDMEINSTAFTDGGAIPTRFTCDGANVSPPIDISFPPSGAVTLTLIMDDPDAPVGTWDHWIEFDIPIEGDEVSWPEDVGRLATPGNNSWNITGYGGPCPPEGQNHRYFFKLYALDTELLLPEGADSDAVRSAMEGHILAEAQVMGTYSR